MTNNNLSKYLSKQSNKKSTIIKQKRMEFGVSKKRSKREKRKESFHFSDFRKEAPFFQKKKDKQKRDTWMIKVSHFIRSANEGTFSR